MVRLASIAAMLAGVLVATPALAQSCRPTISFERWLDAFKQEAQAEGISQATISAALGGAVFDQEIVRKDRAQGVFSQTFLQFSDRMVAQYRMQQGAA